MKYIFLLLPILLYGQTTWYVSNSGNDSNAGTSSGSPLLTIAAAQDSAVTAGDSCLFNKGDTWREQLTVGASGSSGSPIYFGSYGSGALPIITRALYASLTNISGDKYQQTGISSDPVAVWFRDTLGTEVANSGLVDSEKELFYKRRVPGGG